MKRSVFSALLLVALVVFSQHIVFADEIYQDENGVWTNRPRSGASTKSEVSISEGLNAVSRGFVEGAIGIMDSTVGEASRDAIKGIGEKSSRGMGSSAYKTARDSEVTKAYTEFWQGVGDEYMAEWRCKNRGICPRIMAGEKLEEYENFDEAKAKEFKSEWEFFEDSR